MTRRLRTEEDEITNDDLDNEDLKTPAENEDDEDRDGPAHFASSKDGNTSRPEGEPAAPKRKKK